MLLLDMHSLEMESSLACEPSDLAIIANNCDADRQPAWPGLEALALSADQQRSRLAGIGGSDANIILSGEAERIERLWREKRGEVEAEDLCQNLRDE